MRWTEVQIRKLKNHCKDGVSNKDMALYFGCSVGDVYAKRSQLGITITQCKGIKANPEFEKSLAPIAFKGMSKDVKNALSVLGDAVLFSMARDWVGMEDADEYCLLANELIALESSYNKRIGR